MTIMVFIWNYCPAIDYPLFRETRTWVDYSDILLSPSRTDWHQSPYSFANWYSFFVFKAYSSPFNHCWETSPAFFFLFFFELLLSEVFYFTLCLLLFLHSMHHTSTWKSLRIIVFDTLWRYSLNSDCNMLAFFSFDLFMVYIPKYK